MDNDFSQKIGSILSDPEMMQKIKAIAGSLGNSPPKEAPPRPPEPCRDEAPCHPRGNDCCMEEKPCECEQKGAHTCSPPAFSLPTGAGGSDLARNIANSRALLTALKPYLDKERCERIDKILGMMKIAEIMGYIK